MKWLLHLILLFSANLLPAKDLIVDTDSDLGDMVAILYLLNSSEVQVKAISTSGVGLTHARYSAEHILNLIQLADHPNIPVSVGTKTSLSPHTNFPKRMRDFSDKSKATTLPKNPKAPNKLYSADLIESVLLESEKPVSILCLGPLTNLATVLEKDTPAKKNIEHIYLLGTQKVGEDGPGEFNILLDAKAASIVLQSGLPVTIIPLEQQPSPEVSASIHQNLSKSSTTASGKFIFDILNESSPDGRGALLWASVAAVYVTHPEMSETLGKKISITLTHESINYGGAKEQESGSPIHFMKTYDADIFKNSFISKLKKTP